MNQNQLHLLIPQLIEPLALWNKDFGFSAKSTVFAELLANHKKVKNQHHGLMATLFALLNSDNSAELPIAHYRYREDFGKEPNSQLLCADPVHLQTGIDEIVLTPHKIDDLSRMDVEELIEALNLHFAQDNWEFVVAESGNWYLKHQSTETIKTTPIDHAFGKSIFKYLPQSDTLNWHSLQNEIQMLLHMQSLNQSREIASQMPINSLWFWGGGSPVKLEHEFQTIWSNSSTTNVAALAGNIEHKQTSAPKEITFDGQQIVILDELFFPALQDQYDFWQSKLSQLEDEWIAPLANHCKKAKADLFIHDCNGRVFEIQPSSKWKFWKKEQIELIKLA